MQGCLRYAPQKRKMAHMSRSVPLSFPLDAEGFLSQECPTCERRFKVKFSQEPDGKFLSHCPYCGHEGQKCWWTSEQVTYIQSQTKASVINPLLRDFQRDLQGLNNQGAGITVRSQPIRDPQVVPPAETNEAMRLHTFACCDEQIKIVNWEGPVHCIICGKVDSID
jgi:hypothetical protein